MFFSKEKSISRWPLLFVFMKRKSRTVIFYCFREKKNMSKHSLLSVFITNVAVVAILTASISAAHPGSPPPDRTASGQRFATAAFLVSLHGLWPDNRVCTLSGQLFCGMPTQTADNADSLSDNPDDHLHAPPVYNGLFDPRSKIGRNATLFSMLHAMGRLRANQSVLVPSHSR